LLRQPRSTLFPYTTLFRSAVSARRGHRGGPCCNATHTEVTGGGMDASQAGDGRQRVTLGPIERWIALAVGGAVVTGLSMFGQTMVQRLDRQNETLQAVVTQQAVTNGKVDTLTTQLADVPRLTREMAEMKVRVERGEQDIRDDRGWRAP